MLSKISHRHEWLKMLWSHYRFLWKASENILQSYSGGYSEHPSGEWDNYQCPSLSEKAQTFCNEILPGFLKHCTARMICHHGLKYGKQLTWQFPLLFLSLMNRHICKHWLTERSMSLCSRCVFGNTAWPANPGSASVWYRGFWKLFLFFLLVKAWEDSVGNIQKTQIYYNLISPSQIVSSRKHTRSSFVFTKASYTSRNEDRTMWLSTEATTFLSYHKYSL